MFLETDTEITLNVESAVLHDLADAETGVPKELRRVIEADIQQKCREGRSGTGFEKMQKTGLAQADQ